MGDIKVENRSIKSCVTILSGQCAVLGGPAQNLSNFQMAPIPILSVLTCSTSSPHDILKVSLKKNYQNLPIGGFEHDIVHPSGFTWDFHVFFT